MKKAFAFLLTVVLALAAVVVVRGLMVHSVQMVVEPIAPMAIDDGQAAEHLAEALRIRTISYDVETAPDKDSFEAFHHFLETTYPKAQAVLRREIVGDYSLLYTWKGSDSALKPLLIMGHMDVVPVPDDTVAEWQQPPFEGRIVDGVVWGRGALDDKVNVIGAMEAVEYLLAAGFQPKRTILLAFGHDEELGGNHGAAEIAALLKERGIDVECAVDEGGCIRKGMVPGIETPIALIGIAEKGYMSVRLKVEQPGGHSSMPPEHSAIGIVSRAVTRLEDDPFPGGLSGPTRAMFAALSPEMPFAQRTIFANLWLFRPVVEHILAGAPETNATLRTTTAVTMIEGGVKDNVLPSEATGTVNFRIMPGETTETVLARVRKVINDDRVTVELADKTPREPSIVSDINAPAYGLVEKTIREVFPDVVVGPFLVLGGTDLRHYESVSHNLYRFVPLRMGKGDTDMLHGKNERISVQNFGEVCRFYAQLIRNFNA